MTAPCVRWASTRRLPPQLGQERALDVPTLVLHGLADTLRDPSGGRATAAAIPGAELVLIDGMGHNLPPGLWERIADHIAAIVRKGEARAPAWMPSSGRR